MDARQDQAAMNAGWWNASHLRRLPWLTLAVGATAVALQWVPSWSGAAAYDRAAIAAGEIWRLATGHVTHWNFDHLVWDVLMFGVLGTLIERRSRQEWFAVVVGSATAISLWLWAFEPAVVQYRGLSGIDSALFTCAAVAMLRDARRSGHPLTAAAIMTLLAGFAMKIGYEHVTGSTLFVDSTAAGFVPLPLVHAVGGVVGCAVAALEPLRRAWRRPAADRSPLYCTWSPAARK